MNAHTEQLPPCWRRQEHWHRIVPGEYAIKDIRVSGRWVHRCGNHHMRDVIDANGKLVESWAYLRHAKQKALELAA
jgi:hypothetical protein